MNIEVHTNENAMEGLEDVKFRLIGGTDGDDNPTLMLALASPTGTMLLSPRLIEVFGPERILRDILPEELVPQMSELRSFDSPEEVPAWLAKLRKDMEPTIHRVQVDVTGKVGSEQSATQAETKPGWQPGGVALLSGSDRPVARVAEPEAEPEEASGSAPVDSEAVLPERVARLAARVQSALHGDEPVIPGGVAAGVVGASNNLREITSNDDILMPELEMPSELRERGFTERAGYNAGSQDLE